MPKLGRWIILAVILLSVVGGLAALALGGMYEKGFSVVGSVASLFGIAYTAVQIMYTKDIAEAARDAAEESAREMRNSFYRYSLFTARRLLGELKAFVQFKKWSTATLRADDLADHASMMAFGRPRDDDEWTYATKSFRAWAHVFRRGVANRSLDFSEADWSYFCEFVQQKIDSESDPLGV